MDHFAMGGFPIPPDHDFYNGVLFKTTCVFGHETLMDFPPEHLFAKADPVDPMTFWFSQPLDVIKENCDVIKIYMLLPVLIKPGDRTKCMQTRLAEYSNLSVKELNYVELLEDLADLLKSVATDPHAIEGVLRIGAKTKPVWTMKPFPLSEALNWVLDAGGKVLHAKLQSPDGIRALQLFYTDYSFYIAKMAMDGETIVSVFKNRFCKPCTEESEIMKMMGNDAFAKGHFDLAVDNYSEAIRFCPNNHLLFSNRALCFTRMGKYEKALNDGKKAITLKYSWPKGHYRFCEALFMIGERDRALASNEKAQELCKDNPEGIRDLVQQHAKFKKQIEEMREMKPKRRSGKRQSHEKKMAAQFSAHVDSSESKKTPTAVREDAPTKDSTNGSFTENKVKDDITGQNVKAGKSKARGGDCDEVMEAHCNADSYGVQMVDFCRPKQMFLPALQELVKTQVQEACTALEKQRCHSALGNFERLLDILQQTDFKKLHLNNIDCAVLQYGLASALLGIGQSEELTKAEEQFKQIQHQYSKERFNCLAVYGIGNVYFRQNRFSEALKQYVKSQTMVTHKIMPGVLNWPLTDAVIDESVPEKLKVILENRIEECKFPPRPDAVCRYEQCYGLPKTQIYFTDPDFKGFIRILCSRFCKVEFHICCWKKLKTLIHSDKVDKDFLKSACLTPDCHGRICHIVIYDSTGVVKCEFEDKTVKKKEPQKSLFKQKGNSNKKSKVKTENKAEHKKITQKDTIKVQVDKNDKQVTCRSDDKVNHQHAMPYEIMLAHIAQKEELLISGLGDTKNFQDLLVLWEVISREDLDTLALQPCSSASEEMALLLKYLYRLNNRVKSRVFLYLLGKCEAFLSMELLNWLIMIEDKGFEAAANFQVSNMDILKKLNTEAVTNRWNATYGKYLNVTIMESGMEGVIGIVTKVEILQRFIWFLEENRGTISLHGLDEALDLYFTEMDTPYYNFKPKSVSESSSTNCIKVKNKHKKKKQKLPKAVYTLSGGLSTRSQEEDILTEEDMFLLNPLEPFIVPGFLRHDIEEFETTYEPDFGLNPDLWPIDNAEIVRETLYDYFSQILDECGPLEVDDDLLVGEYSGFPDETHRIVENAGGLKNFLLESNRFAAVGERLGLQIHASLLDDTSELAFLNPTAKEFSPSTNKPSSEIFHSVSSHTSPIPYFQSPILINPPLHNNFVHTFTPSFPLFNVCVTSVPLLAPGTTLIPTPNISVMPDRPVDIVTTYSTETYNVDKPDRIQPTNVKTNQKTKHKNTRNLRDLSPRNHNLQAAPPRNKKTAIVAVQVDIEVSEQDVNTDPYQPFETQQGDILRMEKEILVVKEHLKEATEKYEHLRGRYQSEKEGFNKQIRGAIESHKIAKKELDCLNQDLEGVVKKWHQEKKENQEKIKAIKSNSKLVTETNERYSKEIAEMKRQYDKYLENFIHICVSNFEKERSMVEKRTIDLQDVLAGSSARAIAAEVKVLENKKESERSKLKIKALKAVENIALFKAMASSQPSNPEYPKQINDMGAVLASVTPEMEKITKKFEEKIKLVKSGSKLRDVLNIPGSKAPPSSNPAISQTQTSAGVLSSTRASSSQPSPFSAAGAEGAAAKSPLKSNPASKPALLKKVKKSTASAVKSKVQVLASSQEKGASNLERSGFLPSDQIHLSPSKQTPFDQIIKDLQDIFPDYKSGVLAVFISEVRSRAGGTLGGMKPEEIIARVTEYILDLQAKSEGVPSRAATMGNTNRTAQPGLAAQTKQPWRVVPGSTKTKFQNTNKCAISPDEPCIICHDDLKQHPQHMLDCGHWFHKHCITKWLHTQSTCPTCRDHALLPEDFPALSGRLRTT